MSTLASVDQIAPHHELNYAAHALAGSDRQTLALPALSGQAAITELSQQRQVSRKFVYRQKSKAQEALDAAFDPSPDEEGVPLYLPVTKAWLRQVVLGLVLICHSSFRGVMEFFEALLDHPIRPAGKGLGSGPFHRRWRRNYFFLRKQPGPEYLDLLRFFLSHRRFIRGEYELENP